MHGRGHGAGGEPLELLAGLDKVAAKLVAHARLPPVKQPSKEPGEARAADRLHRRLGAAVACLHRDSPPYSHA